MVNMIVIALRINLTFCTLSPVTILHCLDKGLENYQHRSVFMKSLCTSSTSFSRSQNRAISHVYSSRVFTRAQSPSFTAVFRDIYIREHSKEESFFLIKNSTKLICSSSLLKGHHVCQVIVAAKQCGKAKCNPRF